ncbi:MAG: anaerobic ribonucleoside-triphosphate reductase activating protein [Bacilli bacterium]|nr:anaerobic ribonucleoside-triphosphate reductase activating protein [Bacilli bacterium]
MNEKFVGIEKLSLVDYEGKLACTLFTKRCNFKCVFCHNSSLVFDCNLNEIDDEVVFDYLKKRKNQLDAVVITGGEPTLMSTLKDKIIKIKHLGYLVKLDTNGTNPDVIKELHEQNLIDYIAMDIKSSLIKYPLITDTKVYCENIKKSINYIINNFKDYEFRITLIDEFHDFEDIKQIAKLINGADKLYLQCFIDNGNCIKKGLNKVDIEKVLNYKKYLEEYVKKVELRNYVYR